jgi:hypothetical protein
MVTVSLHFENMQNEDTMQFFTMNDSHGTSQDGQQMDKATEMPAGARDGNGSGSGRVDEKSDPK